MKTNSHKKGFTLIELLVVIAIISLLSSIILASLNDARKKGRDSVRVQSLIQIRNALQLYFADNGSYPGVGTDLATNFTNLQLKLVSKYISSLNPSIYYYGRSASGNSACTTNTCPGYHLAINLETDSNVLQSDSKGTTGLNPPGPGFVINGATSDCMSATPGNDRCYDLIGGN